MKINSLTGYNELNSIIFLFLSYGSYKENLDNTLEELPHKSRTVLSPSHKEDAILKSQIPLDSISSLVDKELDSSLVDEELDCQLEEMPITSPESGKIVSMLRRLENDDICKITMRPFINLPRQTSLPSYYDIIKRPIDLTIIHQKVDNRVYNDFEEFEMDFNLQCQKPQSAL